MAVVLPSKFCGVGECLFPVPFLLCSSARFAFSPLSEEDEEDEQKEPMLKESFGELWRKLAVFICAFNIFF